MRKISLILVILVLTAPAWAAVNITIEPNATDPCQYDVLYQVTGDDAETGVRAFALDIYVTGGPNIVDVNDYHAGESDQDTAQLYGIYPSNFARHIDPEGDPIDWGSSSYTPLGNDDDYPEDTLDGLDTNGITVEMGALYVGEGNEPLASGKLLEIVLSDECEDEIRIKVNDIRGAIVLEDNSSPSTTNLPYTYSCVVDCLIGGNAGPLEYSDWSNPMWGKPDCWCYCRQCRGDLNGYATFGQFVAISDLAVLYDAYNKSNAVLATIENGICADFDHKSTFGIRVAISDLAIAYNYYGKPYTQIPKCDEAPIITGPYNYWVIPPGSSCP
jgi:hypothetical protein